MRLGSKFPAAAFERAFERFIQLYNVAPEIARCSPDVLERFCKLYESSADAAREREVRYRGVPVVAAVLPGGTIAFEGDVDEDRMGDW